MVHKLAPSSIILLFSLKPDNDGKAGALEKSLVFRRLSCWVAHKEFTARSPSWCPHNRGSSSPGWSRSLRDKAEAECWHSVTCWNPGLLPGPGLTGIISDDFGEETC